VPGPVPLIKVLGLIPLAFEVREAVAPALYVVDGSMTVKSYVVVGLASIPVSSHDETELIASTV
jgi:hypothetical protein